MKKEKLLPCPFCGTQGNLLIIETGDYLVECCRGECCVGPYRGSEKEAIVAWNQRIKNEK